MIRTERVVTLLLLASLCSAKHEDIVDRILRKISDRLSRLHIPPFAATFTPRILGMDTEVSVYLQKGSLSSEEFLRTDVVYYKSSGGKEVFKFPATLFASLSYEYQIYSSSYRISSGTVEGRWRSYFEVTAVATSSDCKLKIWQYHKTSTFDLSFQPYDPSQFPFEILFPPEDTVEKNMLPVFNAALEKALKGIYICSVVDSN